MFPFPQPLVQLLHRTNLVSRILIGLVLGIVLAWLAPQAALQVSLLGELFVLALKAVAPVLVLVLVVASLPAHQHGQPTHIRPVLLMYLISTFCAAALAVAASFLFPTSLKLDIGPAEGHPPGSITEVLHELLVNIFIGPVQALNTSNHIAILAWAVALGLLLRHAAPATRSMLQDVSKAFTGVVQDSFETALNSHTDVVFTAAVSYAKQMAEVQQEAAAATGPTAVCALQRAPAGTTWPMKRS